MTESMLVRAGSITGRFTLEEFSRLIEPGAWPSGVPETYDAQEREGLRELLEQVEEYLEKTPGACAVDIVEGQVLNVVTHHE